MATDEVKKVPVAKNEQQAQYYLLTFTLGFEAMNEASAREMHARIAWMLEGHCDIISEELSIEPAVEGGQAVVLFQEDENEADAALRKLTQNQGNKLWIDYLQKQLEMAKKF